MLFAKQINVTGTQSDNGTYWAFWVVTSIGKRMQKLEEARQMIFVDAMSSCDHSHCSTTVALPATKADAVPMAVFTHSSQAAWDYSVALNLVK